MMYFFQVFISVIGDQPANAREAQRIGFGIHQPFQQLTGENLATAVDQVLHDPKYAAMAKQHGSAVVDQKEHPLDRAIWWLEHTIRHPKIYQGKNPVHRLNIVQYFGLDVLTFMFAVLVLVIFILKKIVTLCCCRAKRHQKSD